MIQYKLLETKLFINKIFSVPIVVFICSAILILFLKIEIQTRAILILLIFLGVLLEEALHLLFILIFYTGIIKVRLSCISFIVIAFSWIVPEKLSVVKKIITVIVPPLVIVLISIISILFSIYQQNITGFQIRKTIAFCTISIISLIPLKFGSLITDMRQVLILVKKR